MTLVVFCNECGSSILRRYRTQFVQCVRCNAINPVRYDGEEERKIVEFEYFEFLNYRKEVDAYIHGRDDDKQKV